MVEGGAFREDLYYRLNVIPIRVPPLRERRADIPLLAQHFLDRLARESTPPRGRVALSQDATQALMAYAWPGNVRQLENVVERALALSPGRSQLTTIDLPDELRNGARPLDAAEIAIPEEGIDLTRMIEQFERSLIQRALDRADGSKQRAADLLHLKRTTLVQKIKRLEEH
jgi:transcriptional regulator with PAS, ATPase and Fis domain